jgi:hypothetical protein
MASSSVNCRTAFVVCAVTLAAVQAVNRSVTRNLMEFEEW